MLSVPEAVLDVGWTAMNKTENPSPEAVRILVDKGK